ncbi:hypothetical protein LBYS11_16385 [Lysinibacillus sp. YS11]|uniref:hypothetical protein n=1 Tax=Lysinibacillus sp. YS11 TaxID=2072025 RepID=UPI000CA0C380|nr:hypothetical protein [Lysinibacillus sp. YS11]AUS87816.1 hypothetical protein LBYS11_16385 [Lysinibacillus sp. YS11]
MAKLTNFVFCENDENFRSQSGVFSPLDIVEVNTDEFSLNIVFTVCDYSLLEDNTCRIIVKDPQNNDFFDTDFIHVPNDTPGSVDNKEVFMGFTLGVSFNNLPFKGSGFYSVEVLFNEEKLNTFHIPVTFLKEGE